MHRGYTKRWRKRWDKGYHKDYLLWVMMDYFIDFANHKDKKLFFPNCGEIVVKRGQHIFGTRQMAKFLGVGRQRVRGKLAILENIHFLTLKPTHQYTIATVINYDTYNPSENGDNPQTNQDPTQSQPTLNPPLTRPNNVNNVNNKEVQPQAASSMHFSSKIKSDYTDKIIQTCNDILQLPTKNGTAYNPYQFVQRAVNRAKHPAAILESLEATRKAWSIIKSPWSYSQKILETKSPTYNERSHTEESQQFKRLWAGQDIKNIIREIG